jgi:hypothetical protein
VKTAAPATAALADPVNASTIDAIEPLATAKAITERATADAPLR